MISSRILQALFYLILSCSVAFSGTTDTLKIRATLDHERKSITGSVSIDITAIESLDSFEFQLFPNVYSSKSSAYLQSGTGLKDYLERTGKWGSMEIDSILIAGKNETNYFDVEYTMGRVLPKPRRNIGGNKVDIFFKTYLPERGDRLSYMVNDYLLDGWFPSPAVFDSGKWRQPVYGPQSELVGDFYYYDIKFTFPNNNKVAASALPVDSTVNDTTTVYHYKFGPAHDFALALSPDFQIDSFNVNSATILVYYRDFEQKIIDRLKYTARQTFEYMEKNVGSYPYSHFSIALMDIPYMGGVEFPGMTVISSPRGGMMLTRYFESLIIHELVHQWFYGVIGSDQIEDPWLDESIANLFVLRIMGNCWGKSDNLFDLGGFQMTERDQLRTGSLLLRGPYPLDISANGFPDDGEYFKMIYSRGALLAETIENIMGDSLSGIFWKSYFEKFQFGRPATSDFVEHIKYICGDSITNIARQLIHNANEIDYSVYEIENTQIDSVTYRSKIVLMNKGGLEIPVDYLLILNNGDTVRQTWYSENKTDKFVFNFESPVVTAIIDPDQVITVDINLFNNSYSLKADNTPGFRISSGILFLIESMYSFLGGM